MTPDQWRDRLIALEDQWSHKSSIRSLEIQLLIIQIGVLIDILESLTPKKPGKDKDDK